MDQHRKLFATIAFLGTIIILGGFYYYKTLPNNHDSSVNSTIQKVEPPSVAPTPQENIKPTENPDVLFDENKWVALDTKMANFGSKNVKIIFLRSSQKTEYSGVAGEEPDMYAVDFIITQDGKIIYHFLPDGSPKQFSGDDEKPSGPYISMLDETGDGIPELLFTSTQQGASDWYTITHILRFNQTKNTFDEIEVPGCYDSWHEACTKITLGNTSYYLVAGAYSTPDTCHGCAHDHMYNIYRWSDSKSTFELWQAVQAPTASESGDEALKRDTDYIRSRFITTNMPQKFFSTKEECEKDTHGQCFPDGNKWTPRLLLPDLAITGVEIAKTFKVGVSGTAKYMLKNIGHASMQTGWNLRIEEINLWEQINQPARVTLDSSLSNCNRVLQVGDECTVTAQLFFPTTDLYGAIKATINTNNLSEAQDGNNVAYSYVDVKN